MNNPLQGETIFFSGFLKDDEGNNNRILLHYIRLELL